MSNLKKTSKVLGVKRRCQIEEGATPGQYLPAADKVKSTSYSCRTAAYAAA
jgi:hypothetical protein